MDHARIWVKFMRWAYDGEPVFGIVNIEKGNVRKNIINAYT